MSFELVNALTGIGTFLVIAATAAATMIQLRHLRAGNDLQGLLKILEMAYEPAVQDAFDYLTHDFPERVKDPEFLGGLAKSPIDSHVHKELIACEYYERLGSYVKNRLIAAELYLDCSSPAMYWDMLVPVIAVLRSKRGPSAYENFEYLVALEKRWDALHPNGNYPRGVERLFVRSADQS